MSIPYGIWEKCQIERGIDVDSVNEKLKELNIDIASWILRDSGTRFKVFKQKSAAKNVFNVIKNASLINGFTGIASSIVIQNPLDINDTLDAIKKYADEKSIKITTVHANLQEDEDYIFGSVTNINANIRKRAIRHINDCIDIMRGLSAKKLSLWFADGTNYPGQGNFLERKEWMIDCLKEIYSNLDSDMEIILEYKLFEPAFYHTDIADWGTASSICTKLGNRARVIIDLGHHAQGTNVENIVSHLLSENMLGGLHFNDSKYGDDDLISGTINPFKLFLAFNEIVSFSKYRRFNLQDISLTIDQSHNIEPKIPATILSLLNIQTAYAKALLVNHDELRKYQIENDVIGTIIALKEAFESDISPLLERVREEAGIPINPMKAFYDLNLQEEII